MNKLVFCEISVDCPITKHTALVGAYAVTKIELKYSIAHGKNNQLRQANYSTKNALGNALGL
jgi:hypothetical protein